LSHLYSEIVDKLSIKFRTIYLLLKKVRTNMDASDSRPLSAHASEYTDALGDDKLEFIELETNDDFKTKICLPYFKDIFKDLQSRSDNP